MSEVIIPAWQRPVVRVPLNQAFPQMGEITEFKNRVCLFNHDRSKLFDVVSPRYQLVEHAAGIQRIEDALVGYFGKGKAPKINVRTSAQGARLSAIAELPIPQIKIAKGDISAIRLEIRNSYDRSCVFRASLAALRLVCTNGMTTTDQWGGIRMKHIAAADQGDAEERRNAHEDLMHRLDQMVSNAPKLREQWTKWADQKVSLMTAQEMVADAFPRMYTDPILDDSRWKTERTMWDLYNDLTHMSSHLTKSLQRRQSFDDIIARMFYDGETVLQEGDQEDSDD